MKRPVRKRKGYAAGGSVTAYDFDPVKAARGSPGVEDYDGPDTQPRPVSRESAAENVVQSGIRARRDDALARMQDKNTSDAGFAKAMADTARAGRDFDNSRTSRQADRIVSQVKQSAASVGAIQQGMAGARQSMGARDDTPGFRKGGKVKKVVPIKRKGR